MWLKNGPSQTSPFPLWASVIIWLTSPPLPLSIMLLSDHDKFWGGSDLPLSPVIEYDHLAHSPPRPTLSHDMWMAPYAGALRKVICDSTGDQKIMQGAISLPRRSFVFLHWVRSQLLDTYSWRSKYLPHVDKLYDRYIQTVQTNCITVWLHDCWQTVSV